MSTELCRAISSFHMLKRINRINKIPNIFLVSSSLYWRLQKFKVIHDITPLTWTSPSKMYSIQNWNRFLRSESVSSNICYLHSASPFNICRSMLTIYKLGGSLGERRAHIFALWPWNFLTVNIYLIDILRHIFGS